MNAHTLARTLLYNIIKELHKSYKSVQIGKRRKEGRKDKAAGGGMSAAQRNI